MPYILLWVVFNPVYLGEFASLEACNRAKETVAAMAREGNSAAASSAAAMGVKMPPTSQQDYGKVMACLPKG